MSRPRKPIEPGTRFGMLVVLGEGPPDAYGASTSHSRCDCGTEKVRRNADLRSGDNRSCGCGHWKRVRDVIQPPKNLIGGCPRCGALAYEGAEWGICCTDESGCGWRQRYPAGTTHRADGSSIDDATRAGDRGLRARAS